MKHFNDTQGKLGSLYGITVTDVTAFKNLLLFIWDSKLVGNFSYKIQGFPSNMHGPVGTLPIPEKVNGSSASSVAIT